MNRDEKVDRPAGLPPAQRIVAGTKVVGPSEPGGGMWISLSGRGVSLALINWYSVPARVDRDYLSRGTIVQTACAAAEAVAVADRLAKLPLGRINPFRLIGVFPRDQTIVEWRWDLQALVEQHHPWLVAQWISSGFDEAVAQRIRGRTFRAARLQPSAGSLAWLRRLHRSHVPVAGPCSMCMHRADAATVSYTEISVAPHLAAMRHHSGPPCRPSLRSCPPLILSLNRSCFAHHHRADC